MIQKSQENSKAIAVYNNEMKSFAQQYSVLARTNKEMSKLRHDWKQHLRMICGLVQGNNFDKLKIYVNGLSEIVENERTSYVGDPVIDIILSGFVQTAKQSGIEVDIVTDLKYTLEINPIDLCILISNSTDNAIEACRRMTTDSNREIWIGVKTDDKHLFYTIKNTFLGEIQRNGERILSVKEAPEEHGIGLQSIEKVVEKHNGYVTITANNGIFELLSVLDNTNITDYTM
jgi:sensor histidine kinase regulating citrate/malate metabolism